MQIEIFIFMILALSAVSAALLALLVARSGKDKDIEAYLLRLSQEMQDRQSAALDSFRSSIEQRMQALEKSISDISSSQRNQMALFFKENRDLNDKLDKRQKEGTDSISAILSEIRRENTRTMETVLKETAGLTEEVRKIVKGLTAAGADLAATRSADFAAFNIGQDTPQISITEEVKTTTASSLTVRFSTSAGALGFLLDRGSYIVAYATEDATFVVSKPDGTSETITVTGGELETRDL